MRIDLFSKQAGLAALAIGVLSATAACNSKPDTALCGRYYRHTLTVQERDGQPGALAGLKTEGAKRAMLNHCTSELNRAQVDCVLNSTSTFEATACERSAESYADRAPEYEQPAAVPPPELADPQPEVDAYADESLE